MLESVNVFGFTRRDIKACQNLGFLDNMKMLIDFIKNPVQHSALEVF